MAEDYGKPKRTLKIRRESARVDSTPITLDHIVSIVRAEVSKAGLDKIREQQRQVDHNLQVMGVILRDMQAAYALAEPAGKSARARLDELTEDMNRAMSNVGLLAGSAKDSEGLDNLYGDYQGGAFDEALRSLQEYRANNPDEDLWLDTDEALDDLMDDATSQAEDRERMTRAARRRRRT